MRPDKHTSVDPHSRLELTTLALAAMVPVDFPVYVESTEVDNARYYPTRELMCLYRSLYPKLTFKVLIGTDLISGIHVWDDFSELVSENTFIVYDRLSGPPTTAEAAEKAVMHDRNRDRMHIERLQHPHMSAVVSNVSSTEIRRRLVEQGISSIVGLTPLAVIEYIARHNLYPIKASIATSS